MQLEELELAVENEATAIEFAVKKNTARKENTLSSLFYWQCWMV